MRHKNRLATLAEYSAPLLPPGNLDILRAEIAGLLGCDCCGRPLVDLSSGKSTPRPGVKVVFWSANPDAFCAECVAGLFNAASDRQNLGQCR